MKYIFWLAWAIGMIPLAIFSVLPRFFAAPDADWGIWTFVITIALATGLIAFGYVTLVVRQFGHWLKTPVNRLPLQSGALITGISLTKLIVLCAYLAKFFPGQ